MPTAYNPKSLETILSNSNFKTINYQLNGTFKSNKNSNHEMK